MLKKSIISGLLCLAAGQAYANINVTTTEDISADDNICSLREAIIYINQYYSEQPNESEPAKEAREKIKKSGYHGCGGEDVTSAIIILEPEKTYKLNSEVKISKSITIGTDSSKDEQEIGIDNATIQAQGKHRLFNINDDIATINQITVNFIKVNLQGCGLEQTCSDKGGIIFNQERLNLRYVKIFNGYANQGGAIYSDGVISGTNQKSAGLVNIQESIVTNNKAQNGAAVYIQQPLVSVGFSVIRNNINTSTGNNNAIIYSEYPFADEMIKEANFRRSSGIINTTFFKNVGYLFNVRDGLYINNITAVDNTQGLIFEAPHKKAHISNSIVAGNAGQDCKVLTGDGTLFYNNLVSSSACPVGELNNQNIYLANVPNNKLFAGTSSEGACDSPPANGLLCPFKTPENTFLGFFKPRLLSSYSSLNDSPIVNRGRLYSDGSTQAQFSCELFDQRGFTRPESRDCDLGAIELSATTDTITRLGDTITYGQIAKMYLLDSLADGELLPASECKTILGRDTDLKGKAWTDGCIDVEQDPLTTPNSKGEIRLDNDGYLVYTPNSNWHGDDIFNIKVVTTISRFSDSSNAKYILIPIKITQQPNDTFKSEKVKVTGGALGGLSIATLLLLAIRRRIKA